MKAKHIFTMCGVVLGGLAMVQSASAIVTYKGSSEVQFTFNPVLSLSLSDTGFSISGLAPGMQSLSNEIVATVISNSTAGYVLKASVGNSTYNNTDLTSANDKIVMMGSGTTLTKGTWGYTIDNGSNYGALALYTATDATTLATSSSDGGSVHMRIGAYADDNQSPGAYNNVVNFSVVSGIAAHTVTLVGGTLNGGATSGSYNEGDTVTITAACTSVDAFGGWSLSPDFGMITDRTSATTTYTVGNGDVTLNANCAV